MSQQFNNLPDYGMPLDVKGYTTKAWYLFFANLFTGLAPEIETPVTLGASPYTYTAAIKGFVLLSGGTVSLIEYSRDGTTFYSCGVTAGQFTLSAADRIRITYTVAPTTTFVPT